MTLVNGLLSDLQRLNADGSSDSGDKADILRYLNEGRCLISTLNPRFYAVNKTFEIEGPGNIFKICECDQIAGVVGQSKDETCNSVRSGKFPQKWGCKSTEGYSKILDKIRIEKDKNHIYVEPELTDTESVFVTLSCVPTLDTITDETDMSCKDAAALTQWVLYRATMAESNDGDALAVASVYLKTFAEVTNIKLGIIQRELERNT